MKDNPIFKVLKSANTGTPHGPFKMPTPPRVLDMSLDELPELKNAKIGDEICGNFTGRVASLHKDGRAVLDITKIESDNENTETDEPDDQGKPMIVRSDTSPVPS
jgi:hypothetical protein